MEYMDLSNAYTQSIACAACALCLLDGPVPDNEVTVVTGISEDED